MIRLCAAVELAPSDLRYPVEHRQYERIDSVILAHGRVEHFHQLA